MEVINCISFSEWSVGYDFRITVTYLERSRISTTKIFCGNSSRILTVEYFQKMLHCDVELGSKHASVILAQTATQHVHKKMLENLSIFSYSDNVDFVPGISQIFNPYWATVKLLVQKQPLAILNENVDDQVPSQHIHWKII